jgi:hypothetical protein
MEGHAVDDSADRLAFCPEVIGLLQGIDNMCEVAVPASLVDQHINVTEFNEAGYIDLHGFRAPKLEVIIICLFIFVLKN